MRRRLDSSWDRTPGTDREIQRHLWALVVPNVLSNLSVPLLGIADTALVGHLDRIAYLGAISVAGALFDTLYWVFGFLRMGTTAVVSQLYGARAHRTAGFMMIQAVGFGFLVGVLMILLRDPLASVGFRLAGGSEAVVAAGREYFRIRILGAPLVLATYALIGFFRGMKDVMTPLIVTVLVNAANVFLDVGLIYGRFGLPRLEVVGAAWATLLATALGFAAAVAILILRYGRDCLPRSARELAGGLVSVSTRYARTFLGTNFNLFLRTLLLITSYFVIIAVASRMGEAALAANAIVIQIWHLVAYSVDGVAFAAETLVGNALGARAFHRVRRISMWTIVWGVVLGLAYSAAYLGFMRPIARAFTAHGPVVAGVVEVTLWTVVSMPINGIAFVLDGIFIGANDTRYLFLAMLISTGLLFLPALLLFVGALGWGLPGVWAAMFVWMVARAGTLALRYRGDAWIRTLVME
jgi:MATE family multidrug resistance protein